MANKPFAWAALHRNSAKLAGHIGPTAVRTRINTGFRRSVTANLNQI